MPETNNRHLKKHIKTKSFHFRYLELCRSKNYPVLPSIKAKDNNWTKLEFFGDKLKVEDWLLVTDSLNDDSVLQKIRISLRKPISAVLEGVDTERKARICCMCPAIATKFILTRLVESIGNSLRNSKNLTSLSLEGLPFVERYLINISQALSSNISLRNLSFWRSPIQDNGCEIICNSLKHLPDIESINMSQCAFTKKGAESIAELIKFQKIRRFSELWIMSLRYRDVDPDSICGIRRISLNHNSSIGDDGVIAIAEVLKEDAWIKVIEMDNCGISDKGGAHILECVENNKTLTSFSVRSNAIGEQLSKTIRSYFPNDLRNMDEKNHLRSQKQKVPNLEEHLKILEEKLAIEINQRKHAESLNEQLNEQIAFYEKMLLENGKYNVPQGYVIIDKKSLDEITFQRDASCEELTILKQNLDGLKSVRKVKSETIGKDIESSMRTQSKSEYALRQSDNASFEENKMFIERNIGDSPAVDLWKPNLSERNDLSNCRDLTKNCRTSAKSLFLGF